jgi:hypothetical protein
MQKHCYTEELLETTRPKELLETTRPTEMDLACSQEVNRAQHNRGWIECQISTPPRETNVWN